MCNCNQRKGRCEPTKKIGSLFIEHRVLVEFMSDTEPGTLVAINKYDYEPLYLKYETEYGLNFLII